MHKQCIKKLQNGAIYQYGADGNLTFRGTGNSGETYTYSVDGNRLSKEETAGNVSRKTYYVMDNRTGYSQVVLELDGEKEVQAAYGRGDSLLTVRTGEGTKTYITDGHGDVRYLTDEEGNITDSYRYSAYGKLLEKSGNTKNPYLYCGEYYDEGTGLYYLRARYMRPSTGTFISMDSYQGNAYDPASLHRYTYAQNNPQMYNDPSGHFISMIDSMAFAASNSIMNNLHTLNVMGMIGGFMNATVSQVFDTGEDIGAAFFQGYLAGFGIGMVYIGAAAIAAFLEIGVLFHLGMFSIMYYEAAKNIGLAIACHAVGADKEAIMYSVIAVMCVVSACAEYGMAARIAVTGIKGTVEIDISGKANRGDSGIKYYNSDGSPIWPTNRGFEGNPTTTTLEPGTLVDRYGGYDGGTFVLPKGTSYTERALPTGTDKKPYTVFEVVKPVEVQAGKIAPWFGEKGGGIQYEFSKKIADLLEQGILRKVEN